MTTMNLGRSLIRMLLLSFLSWLDKREKVDGSSAEREDLVNRYMTGGD